MVAYCHHNLTFQLFDNKITSPQSDATSIRHYTSLYEVRQTLRAGKQEFQHAQLRITSRLESAGIWPA